MVEYPCPHCGHTQRIADQYLGQRGLCKHCQKQMLLLVAEREYPSDRWRRYMAFPSKIRVDNAATGNSRPGVAVAQKCSPGEPLLCVREPGNRENPNAIALYRATCEKVAYLPKELAADLAPDMDSGAPVEAQVLSVRESGTAGAVDLKVKLTKYQRKVRSKIQARD